MICIVIPNYNGVNHLEVCFSSLKNQTYNDSKIILVDNGSVDGSVEFTIEKYPDVKVINLDKNYGFAYATNYGIRHAIETYSCDHILLLNNDIECDKYFLENMLLGFDNNKIGSTTCKMMNYYDKSIFDTTGDYFDFYSYPFKRGNGEMNVNQYENSGYVFGGCGGATAYRTDVIKNIGLLDESFFAYYEDIDYNYRMQLAGYKCLYVHKAVCYHKCGATIKKNHKRKYFLMERNLTFLQIKNHNIKFIFKYSFISILNRHWNYLRFIKRNEYVFMLYSVLGFWSGIFGSFKYFSERKRIKKLTTVSNNYIESIAMDFKSDYKEFKKFGRIINE